MKFPHTPFTYLSILLICFGIYAIINDLVYPSKMTPMGVYIGAGVIVFSLILIAISYLLINYSGISVTRIWIIEGILIAVIVIFSLL